MPASPDQAVHVHGVQEEYFWLMVHPCPCGGPWHTEGDQVREDGSALMDRLLACCSHCGRAAEFLFQLDSAAGPKAPVRQVNPTPEPSRAIDLAEWLDLARFYLGRAQRLTEAVEKAQSLLDARLCLEEALKFLPPGADAPPPEALWSGESRRKAAENPDLFKRAAIEGMLGRLPPMDRLRQADWLDQRNFEKDVREKARRRVGHKWWQFWKRDW